ncbi:heterokaryon incompatibility protein-domain-containing protein [Lineolata rhizophorae]|uniref:Heterokaryon incompatibility protein-domain-containing protein n=1 Tax=Lineolata rhizophorae TaxID=578093 RepID=A0A6A6NLT8_9PEZI|nr:heterokaryon incompatibility protein-domain-containing protein [Lineolata rhizophorae]
MLSHPNFELFDSRRATFANDPTLADADVLAHAGFFVASDLSKATTCFCCGLQVASWFGRPDPIKHHIEQSPSCMWAKAQNECMSIIQNPSYGIFQEGARRVTPVKNTVALQTKQDSRLRKPLESGTISSGDEAIFGTREDFITGNMSMTLHGPHMAGELEAGGKLEARQLLVQPEMVLPDEESFKDIRLPSDKLCKICAGINFWKAFSSAAGDRPNIYWGYSATNCPVCRLVKQCFQSADVRTSGLKIAKGSLEPFATNHTTLAEIRRLSIELIFAGTEDADERSKLCIQATPLPTHASGRRNERSVLVGRSVNVDKVNFAAISRWISSCDQLHATCGAWPLSGMNFEFRVIDVLAGCVTRAPPKCRYLALSYVWGIGFDTAMLTRDNLQKLSQQGALFDTAISLPATIRDSMILCQKLGERYLWVDSLCILQDSAEDKHDQIVNMDTVYSHAELTIVAAAGVDCNAGLYGVHSQPRLRLSQSVALGEMRLITMQRSVIEQMAASKWNRRAWTLQELVLSNRMLVFTETQAFFYCAESLWTEDAALDDERERINLHEHETFSRQILHPSTLPTSSNVAFSEVYTDLVSSFVNRELSRESDVLDAFAGICRVLEPLLGEFHWGLPKRYFGLSLLWLPHGKATDGSDNTTVSEKGTSASVASAIPVGNKSTPLALDTAFKYTPSSFPAYAPRDAFPKWSWTGWKFEDTRVEFPSPAIYDLLLTLFVPDDPSSLQCIQRPTCDFDAIQSDVRMQLVPPSESDQGQIAPAVAEDLSRLIVFWSSSVEVELAKPWRWKETLYLVSKHSAQALPPWEFGKEWAEQLKLESSSQFRNILELIVVARMMNGDFVLILVKWEGYTATRVLLPWELRVPERWWASHRPTQRKIILR